MILTVFKTIDVSTAVQAVLIFATVLWLGKSLHDFILFDKSGFISGGLLSGGLHAMTGADHLAALLPFIVGKKWLTCLMYGCLWGLGHSCSSTIFAVIGFVVGDNVLKLTYFSFLMTFADVAIGVTLIVIGCLGVLESTLANSHENDLKNESTSTIIAPADIESQKTEDSALSFNNNSHFTSVQCKTAFVTMSTIFCNGLFLGISWDGLPSLAPVLSASDWNGLLLFVFSYSAGTVLSMVSLTSLN